MTRTFQPTPFLEFIADEMDEIARVVRVQEEAARKWRARIRARNHIDPRCADCGGAFVGDVDAVIEFARVGDVGLRGFHPSDLVCAHCWYQLWGDRGGTA